MKQNTTENKGELYSHIKGAKEYMPAKEQVINSLERLLCVQVQEAKESASKDVAIIEVRFACTCSTWPHFTSYFSYHTPQTSQNHLVNHLAFRSENVMHKSRYCGK
jgi:hypothetical protein